MIKIAMDKLDLLLITSNNSQQQTSISVYDYNTANILHQYKNGGNITSKTLELLNDEYVMGGISNKPIIEIWPINSQEPSRKLRMIMPEQINALCLHPNGVYLVAGVSARLYVWHLQSGRLLAVEKQHHQPITIVRFSTDGNYLITAGEDGIMVVWNFTILLTFSMDKTPIYTKTDHSLPITDLYVGDYGHKARLTTISMDQTCKIYNLSTGKLLINLVLESAPTAVIFDSACWQLYVGGITGDIRQFNMKAPPRTLTVHLTDDVNQQFNGHIDQINCLDLNYSNTNLISGSTDRYFIIWDIQSRQILKRIQQNGIITNIKIVPNYQNFTKTIIKSKIHLNGLDKIINHDEYFIDYKMQDSDLDMDENDEKIVKNLQNNNDNMKLRTANKELYNFALDVCQKYYNFK